MKPIYLYFKTPTKQKLIFFRTRMTKSLIWQKYSAMWQSDSEEIPWLYCARIHDRKVGLTLCTEKTFQANFNK